MASQFFGLEIAYSGVQAYNAALNTTANNIANVETKGYSRQKTNQTAADALRTHTSYGMAGAGVTVKGVGQIRDIYYDIKYRNATTNYGEYSTKAYYMKQIENYFNDDGDSILGFNTIYDKFYTAMEDLENNPSDDSTRIAFLGAAQEVSEYFNSMHENLQSLQADVNNTVKDSVYQINSIASQIASLDKQINIIEIQGLTANELRDQRNNLVDELSKFVDIDVVEDEICDQGDPNKPLGIYRYQVYIAGGQTLVNGYEYRTLEVESKGTGNKDNQSDIDGLYNIKWKDTGVGFYPVGNVYSGSLSALLQMRDGNNKEGFKGRIDSFADEDGTNNATVTIKVSKDDIDPLTGQPNPAIVQAFEYLKDVDKTTLNDTGTVVLNGKPYYYDSWTFEKTDDNTVTYTFTLSSDSQQDEPISDIATLIGCDSRVGRTIDYQGIPYYQEQMNEWLRTFARTFNDLMMQGSDANGNAMELALFTAELADGTQPNFADDKNSIVGSKTDSYYRLTAGNITINKKLLKDVSLLATTYKNGDIDKDNSDLIKDLTKIKGDKNMMSFRGCSSAEFLSCVLGDIALNASSANNFEKNYSNIQEVITGQRLSVSGVDDDEEALDLVKFQNAYNLSAKMIQVMTEIYDKLINQTGV